MIGAGLIPLGNNIIAVLSSGDTSYYRVIKIPRDIDYSQYYSVHSNPTDAYAMSLWDNDYQRYLRTVTKQLPNLE